ncbi:glycoside hydrolase family 98 domain-containing protein [Cohnella sp. JJ-181]|uniref:glycoside hydrolase family 98 domain-containing protein n=1 Tax=Cohnella rhizoplanae TaxID=2974897 RepID=UPI0022FFA7C8|nr:glycosyl hydrolase family 98 C-terminal domain-containing protein [Cohnella sp. JJ-181]CAI6039882.1 hypothetical protein COHCIP112018_01042 [Cohnella sp. JJ-181]
MNNAMDTRRYGSARRWTAFLLLVALLLPLAFRHAQTASADAPLRRPISNTNPVFMLTVANNQPQSTVQNIFNSVPSDLRPYVVLSLYYEPIADTAARTWIDAQLTICDQLGIKANAQVGNGWTGSSVDLAFVESLYQNHPSFVGPLFAEQHGTNYGNLASMINLSADYGGYLFNIEYTNGGNGMLSAHSSASMLAAMRAHPDNYVPIAKQTTNSRYHETEAIANGLWTSGLAGNWGVNPDSWTWWETGRAGLYQPEPGPRGANGYKAVVTYPEAQLSMVMLQSAASGSTVFANFEHYTYTSFHDGSTTPAFQKEIIPTMRKIISDGLIPSRAQVRSKIKVAWLSDNDQINDNYYANLYADGTNRDWLRTTGRYYIVPLLIGGTNATERSYFPDVLSTSQYASQFPTAADKLSYFNARYPADATGDAMAQNFLNDKWFIENNLENTNQAQSAVLYPRVNTVDTVKLTMPPQTYAVLKEQSGTLNFRIGNYNAKKDAVWTQGNWSNSDFQNWVKTSYQPAPDESDLRTTTIQVNGHTGASKPVVSIVGYNGYTGYTSTENWNAASKIYTLSITHNGAVDVTIQAAGSNTAHLRPSDNVALNKPATAQFTASGYSAAAGNDADPLSFWDGGNYPSWWQVDLQNVYDIYNVNLTTYYDGTRYYRYTIQASVDGTNWKEIASKTSSSVATASGESYNYGIAARYIRVNMLYNSNNPGVHIRDIKVNGTLSSGIANRALGKTPTASATFLDASRLTDGNKATASYSDSTPSGGLQWVQLDLSSVRSLNNIKLWHYYGDARTYRDVIVRVSNDPAFQAGVTTVFNNDANNSAGFGAGTDAEYAETSGGKSISFSPVYARYVRLYSNGSTANAYNHYVEAEVYGY